MVLATITYLARDPLYDKEKPYATELKFEGAGEAESMNYIFEKRRVEVNPVGPEHKHDLDTHGFCVVRASTRLDVSLALQSPSEVEDEYTEQLAEILLTTFPEYRRVESIDFVASITRSLQSTFLAN